MQVKQFLHTLLSEVIHLKRLSTLILLVMSVLKEKKLSVTLLGRALESAGSEKSNIKRCDRFLSNRAVHREREAIYSRFALQLTGNNKHPWIIVDWSPSSTAAHYILRAALIAKGRALTVYEEVHPKSRENNPKVHEKFLLKLKELLPKDCKPVIVTDAGFSTPWFHQVESTGWDYVGRVRGDKLLLLDNKWMKYSDLNPVASEIPASLGEGLLTKDNAFKTSFYLVKLPKKFRKRLNALGKKGKHKKDREYSKSWNEPWLLVSSLKEGHAIEKKVVKIYSCRMQIEEAFRDLKSSKYGFSFEKSLTKNLARIQVLLLIAMVASIIAYLTGLIAEQNKWHYKFQANTVKNRRVLSLFNLGCRIIKKNFNHMCISSESLVQSLSSLSTFCDWGTDSKGDFS